MWESGDKYANPVIRVPCYSGTPLSGISCLRSSDSSIIAKELKHILAWYRRGPGSNPGKGKNFSMKIFHSIYIAMECYAMHLSV